MAMEAQAVTIGDLIDQHPLSAFQIWTIALCGVVLTLDGFDSLTINFLATSIAHSTGIPVHSFGPIFSASLFGLMIAALTTGPIADRVGRKWPIIFATLSFALFSLLTPRATTYRRVPNFEVPYGARAGRRDAQCGRASLRVFAEATDLHGGERYYSAECRWGERFADC